MSLLKVFQIYVSCRDNMEKYSKHPVIHAKNQRVAKVLEKHLIKKLEKKQLS